MMGVLDMRWLDGELQMLIRYQITATDQVIGKQAKLTTQEERWEPVPTVKSTDTTDLTRFLPRAADDATIQRATTAQPAPGGR